MRSYLPSYGLAALIASLLSTPLHAQETPAEIVRRDLIAQAERARLAGDHAGAVERARRAAEIRATPSIEYFLAREYEALGRAIETLEAAGACARGAAADPALTNRAVLMSACRAVVERSERRVARVRVRVAGALPEGAVVRVGGNTLARAVLDVGYPVEPGTVRVDATAPGHDPWHRELPVLAGNSYDVDVTFVPTPAPPAPPPPAAPAPVVAAVTPLPTRAPRSVSPPPARSVAPLVIGGAASVASFVAAGVFYAVAAGDRDDRDAACHGVPPTCDPSARDYNAQYRTFVFGADAAVGLGAASALAGGLVWWLSRSTRAAEASRVHVVPTLDGARMVGLAVRLSM